jgi:hypothetical protein
MVLQNPTLFMALNELILAITLPHVSSVNCARAMERLKHLIAPQGATDKEAWRKMRDTLRIDESYLKYITRYSVGPRHGSPVHVPGTVTTEVTRRAWIIMNRIEKEVARHSRQAFSLGLRNDNLLSLPKRNVWSPVIFFRLNVTHTS